MFSKSPTKGNNSGLAAMMKITNDTLEMKGAELSVDQARELVVYLKKEKQFKTFSLLYWEIHTNADQPTDLKNNAIVNLTEIFRYNSTLTSFTISGHYIGDTNPLIIAFGEVLKHNCTLQTLEFYAMTFHHNGMKALAEGIMVNRTLQRLNLGQGISLEVGDLAVLVEAVNKNPVIVVVFDAQLVELAKPASKVLLQTIQAKSKINKQNRFVIEQMTAVPNEKREEDKAELSGMGFRR